MSSLPPLPPELQAQLNQRLPEVEGLLDGFITALRSDPKRDPDNLPDYHNTVVAMMLQAEKGIPDGVAMNRHMAALAFIILADTGWAPEDRTAELPPLEDPTKPMRRPKRPRRRRR
jgi:hypothetical protein